MKGDSPLSELATPRPGADALRHTERSQPKTVEEPADYRVL